MGNSLKRAALILALLLSGCSRTVAKCGHKVLTLWPNTAREYVFQTIDLKTLNSPQKLEGLAARVYYGNAIDGHAFGGSPAEPHLLDAFGTCVPADVASAAAVNAYAQFEALYDFERELGTAEQITWPRSVGVDVHMMGEDVDTLNNAHYFGAADAMTLMPYTRSGLPTSFNQAIVAHEHFHAHFQATVIHQLDMALTPIGSPVPLDQMFGPLEARPIAVEDTTNVNPSTPAGINNFVLRGWNEGLADFFASVYANQPDIFAPSWTARARDLRGNLFPLMAARNFGVSLEKNHPTLLRELVGQAYAEGSLLARLLYRLSQHESEEPRVFLKRIMDRLPQLAPQMVRTYALERFNFYDVLPLLLRDYPLTYAVCADLRVVDPNYAKDFAACAR